MEGKPARQLSSQAQQQPNQERQQREGDSGTRAPKGTAPREEVKVTSFGMQWRHQSEEKVSVTVYKNYAKF